MTPSQVFRTSILWFTNFQSLKYSIKKPFLQISEQMQNKKVDELTNKIRIIETEHHRLEEDAFKKQEDLTVTVSWISVCTILCSLLRSKILRLYACYVMSMKLSGPFLACVVRPQAVKNNLTLIWLLCCLRHVAAVILMNKKVLQKKIKYLLLIRFF